MSRRRHESRVSNLGTLVLTEDICIPQATPVSRVRELSLATPMLLAFAALLPLVFFIRLFEPYVAAKEILLIGGAAAIGLAWVAQARQVAVSALWKPLGLLIALASLSLLQVARYETPLLLLSALILFVVAASELRDAERREQLVSLLVAVGTIEAVYVSWQVLAGDPLLPSPGLPGKWRAYGTFGNPDWTGEFLATVILVAIGKLKAKPSRGGFLSLAIMSAGLGATMARGAWLSLAIGMIAMFAVNRKDIGRKVVLLATGSAVAGAAVLVLRSDAWRFLVNLDSLRGRVWMSLVSLKMIVEAPLGVGLGNFGAHFPETQARLFQASWSSTYIRNASFTTTAHNDYLQLIAELGILSIPCLAVLLWMILRRGRALAGDPIALGCWAAIVAFLANGLYAFPLYLPGSLGCAAILLGAVEAAAEGRPNILRIPLAPRLLLAGTMCGYLALAGWWCWNLGIAEHQLDRASAAIAMKQWPKASVALAVAQQHDPGRNDTAILQGRIQLAQREFTAAAETYGRAARLGWMVEAFTGRSTALWYAGQHTEARQLLARLAYLRPDLDWIPGRLKELAAADNAATKDKEAQR